MMTSHEHRRPGYGEEMAGDEGREASPGKRTLVEKAYGWSRPATAQEDQGTAVVMRSAVEASYRDDLAFDLCGGAILRSARASSGAALPDELRGKLEDASGADLGGVTLHTGEASASAADALGARAYAEGSQIHFASGAYDPSSTAGQHLISHEVAHTVQQQGLRRKLAVSSPGDAVEREADAFADAVIAGTAAPSLSGGGGGGVAMRKEASAPGGGSAADGEVGAAGAGNIDPGAMRSLYYGINPPRHAEKAYQASDPSPPLHPRPTTVGAAGKIVALATTIYNKPPFGKVIEFAICDRGGRVLRHGSAPAPSTVEFDGFEPGSEVLIQPMTVGSMVKLLTPEQIAGATEDAAPATKVGGGAAGGAAGAAAVAGAVDADADGEAAGGAAASAAAGGGGGGNIDPGAMRSLYYGINPRRHAEKAYQPGDPAPPLHPRPTTVGASGRIVALATTVYNRPPFGKMIEFEICDRGGQVLRRAAGAAPSMLELDGFEPGAEVLIRPMTMNTMVKLLTPEQIAGAKEDDAAEHGEHGSRAGRPRR